MKNIRPFLYLAFVPVLYFSVAYYYEFRARKIVSMNAGTMLTEIEERCKAIGGDAILHLLPYSGLSEFLCIENKNGTKRILKTYGLFKDKAGELKMEIK